MKYRSGYELLDSVVIDRGVKSVFRMVLADRTTLEFPLLSEHDPADKACGLLRGFFEELCAVPGVRAVLEKHGVVVVKED